MAELEFATDRFVQQGPFNVRARISIPTWSGNGTIEEYYETLQAFLAAVVAINPAAGFNLPDDIRDMANVEMAISICRLFKIVPNLYYPTIMRIGSVNSTIPAVLAAQEVARTCPEINIILEGSGVTLTKEEVAAVRYEIRQLLTPPEVISSAIKAATYNGVSLTDLIRIYSIVNARVRNDDKMGIVLTYLAAASLASNKPAKFLESCTDKKSMNAVLTAFGIKSSPPFVTLQRISRLIPHQRHNVSVADAGKWAVNSDLGFPAAWAMENFYYSSSACMANVATYETSKRRFFAIAMCLSLLYTGPMRAAGTTQAVNSWNVRPHEVDNYIRLSREEGPKSLVIVGDEPGELEMHNEIKRFATAKARPHPIYNNPYDGDAFTGYTDGSKSEESLYQQFMARRGAK